MLLFWKKKQNRKFSKLTNTNVPIKLLKLVSILFGIILLHSLAIFYFEETSIADALWLSFTSITTVGYGVLSAATLGGRLATILLIYIVGIWLLAQLAGDFLDYRADRRERMIRGLWRWKDMSDHVLIINTPSNGGDRYLVRLIEQVKQTPELEALPIEIATQSYPDGLPMGLKNMGVVHYHIDVSSTVHLNDLNIEQAKYIILLCQNEMDVRSDSLTLDMLDRIKQHNSNAFVVAECIIDENRTRFQRLGANAVIRPVRARALSAPGTERVLENLFTHHGASTKRFDVELSNVTWQDIACQLITRGLGTPLGYVSKAGAVVTNPDCNEHISASALLIIVSDDATSSRETVLAACRGLQK